MTALLQASVGVRVEERGEEREVASSHDLEEDCGERMEHSKNMAEEQDRQHGGLRNYDTERHDDGDDIQQDSLQELHINPYWVKRSRLCYC